MITLFCSEASSTFVEKGWLKWGKFRRALNTTLALRNVDNTSSGLTYFSGIFQAKKKTKKTKKAFFLLRFSSATRPEGMLIKCKPV